MTTSAKPLSVAVIGAGMAGRSHAAGYRNVNTVFGAGLPPVRLAAIADANVELGADAARRYGFEALPSWEAVAEDPTIDAVSIVVGNALHRPIAEALVAAGKHVLCEKPLAGSLEDARAMAELERSADVVTAVGYTFRRSPPSPRSVSTSGVASWVTRPCSAAATGATTRPTRTGR